MRRPFALPWLALAAFAQLATDARAQCDLVRRHANDTVAGDRLGAAVALAGSRLVVGAFQDDDAGLSSGAAYVFVQNGSSWSEETKLTADDAEAVDLFGFAVALDGDTLAVGAPGYEPPGGTGVFDSGAVYVFARDSGPWTQQARLEADVPTSGDRFGSAVAVSGDTILVGAPQNDAAGSQAGTAYVFVRSGSSWSQQSRLTGSNTAGPDHFGCAVSLDGDRAAVGAEQANDLGLDTGAAYVFLRSGSSWSEEAVLTRDDPAMASRFGTSVSIQGSLVLVGASHDDELGLDAGAAYVFERTGATWPQRQKLQATDGSAIDLFGTAVALDGSRVVVGAKNDEGHGSIYLFGDSGASWVEQRRVAASDASSLDELGAAVALAGDQIVVGAPYEDGAGPSAGSFHTLRADGCDLGTSYCPATPNSFGTTGYLGAAGSADAADNDLTLFVRDAPPDRFGIFFYGPNAVQLPLGEGVRCVGGALRRLQPLARTDAQGRATRTVDLSVAPASADITSQVPVTMHFQFWHRDSMGSSNLTSALSIDFR